MLNAPELLSKKDAEAKGEKFYFTGVPCKRGHFAKRKVANSDCIDCCVVYFRERYKEKREYYAENMRKNYELNKERYIASATKQRLDGYNVRWCRENKGHVNSLILKRNLDKLKRTPKWADLEKIKKIYIDCPDGMTVDHIIPLRGKLVSGLHVHSNLQYLTKSDNSKKHNSFNPNEWEEIVYVE
jgi:hypothetical protein